MSIRGGKMKIEFNKDEKVVKIIREGLERKGGYCPCRIEKIPENIEGEIAALEEKIEKLEADYLKNSKDFVKLNEITKQKEDAEALLEERMERWMYLEEKAARIANGETE